MGSRQTRCSCPQFLHLKAGAGTGCQKRLNGMKTCSCSKSEPAAAVSHPRVLRATPRSPPSAAGGAEPSLGWFSSTLSHSWGAVPASRGFLSISHPRGTAINIYFKPGLLTSVEKGFCTQGCSEAKRTLKHLHLSDSPRPFSPHCCLSTPALALQDSRAAAGLSQSSGIPGKGRAPSICIRLSCPRLGFHQGPVKANQGLAVGWIHPVPHSALALFSPKSPVQTNLCFSEVIPHLRFLL